MATTNEMIVVKIVGIRVFFVVPATKNLGSGSYINEKEEAEKHWVKTRGNP